LNRRTKTIDAVFFDFGDTLVSLSPSKEEIFIKATRSVGLELNLEAVKLAYRMIDFQKKYSSIKIRNAKQRYCFYYNYNKHLCNALGISSYFEKLGPKLFNEFKKKQKWKLINEVKFVLKELLRRNILLSIVANWDRNLSFEAERLGIKKYFASIITSQEAGFEKPDVKIFNYALKKLSLSARSNYILYVGNEYETDILGARRAGLVPVLIDRGGHYPHADCMRYDSMMQWYRSFVLENEGR
jgi:HAD superfamily hydrolase (TIGR01549 family)